MDMPSAHATVLQELRRKLDTELAELTAPLERGASIQFGKRVGDGTAEAQALLTSNARIAQLLAHREQVDRALAKVEAGTYGRCDGCDMAIPAARLALRPESTHCVQCASARRSH